MAHALFFFAQHPLSCSRGGFQDEGFDDLPVPGSGIDDFPFDVGAVHEAHLDGTPFGRLRVGLAKMRCGLQDKRFGGGFHAFVFTHDFRLLPPHRRPSVPLLRPKTFTPLAG